MSGNIAIPHSSHPLVNKDGTPNRVWYLYLQAIANTVNQPSVPAISGEPRPPNAAALFEDQSQLQHTHTTQGAAAPEHTSTGYASEHDTEPPKEVGNVLGLIQGYLQDAGVLTSSGGLPPGGGGTSIVAGDGMVPITKTANYSISYADNGAQFDNCGAAGNIIFTLPAWAAGLRYGFVPMVAHTIEVVTTGADTIDVNGASFGTVTSALQYSSLLLVSTNCPGIWIVAAQVGSWNYV